MIEALEPRQWNTFLRRNDTSMIFVSGRFSFKLCNTKNRNISMSNFSLTLFWASYVIVNWKEVCSLWLYMDFPLQILPLYLCTTFSISIACKISRDIIYTYSLLRTLVIFDSFITSQYWIAITRLRCEPTVYCWVLQVKVKVVSIFNVKCLSSVDGRQTVCLCQHGFLSA